MKKAVIFMAIVLISLLGSYEVNAQYSLDYSVTGGLAIMNIIGKNPAALPFYNVDYLPDGTEVFSSGGSFQETQSGFDLNFRMPIDDKDKIRIPIGLECIFFRSKELEHVITSSSSHDFLLENKLNLATIYSGLHYVLFKYPDYDINVYTGFELRATYQGGNSFVGTEIFRDGTPDKVYPLTEKFDAFRIGTAVKFGGEGRLYKKLYANWFFALTALNVIGLDKSRGEFLTPQKRMESGESIVFTYQIGFQLQYKFME